MIADIVVRNSTSTITDTSTALKYVSGAKRGMNWRIRPVLIVVAQTLDQRTLDLGMSAIPARSSDSTANGQTQREESAASVEFYRRILNSIRKNGWRHPQIQNPSVKIEIPVFRYL